MATGVAQKDSQLRLIGWAKRHPGKLASLQLIRMDQKIGLAGLSFSFVVFPGCFAVRAVLPSLFLLRFLHFVCFSSPVLGLRFVCVYCFAYAHSAVLSSVVLFFLLVAFANWHCCQLAFLPVAWSVFCVSYPVQVSAGSSKPM